MKEKSLGTIINEKTGKFIKEISGGDIRYKSKLVDNVVTFIGASGGVGVTTLIANIGWIMSTKNLMVLLIDCNLVYPSLNNFFKVRNTVRKDDLVSFLLGDREFESCIENDGNIILSYAHNRTIIDSLNCDNPISAKNMDLAIERLKEIFDIIIIDGNLNCVSHDVFNTVLYKSDTIYLVWDENVNCILNTDRFKRSLIMTGVDSYKIRAIINKRTDVFYSGNHIKKLGIEVDAILPFDIDIVEAGLNKEIFCRDRTKRSRNAIEFDRRLRKLVDDIVASRTYINF